MKIIKTSQAMPEAGEYVLAWLENTTTPMRAMWVAQFTLPVGDDADPEWGEYCEEKDEYFCPAGWYEMNRHEEQHWSVDGNVVAWCELPRLDHQCLAQIEEPAAPAAVAGPAREEIAALRAEHGITSTGRGIKEFEQVDAFVRAVLQRWGAAPALEAPAPAIGPKLARIMGYREHYRTWGRQLSDATELVESHPSHWRIVAEAMDEIADAQAAAPQAPAAPREFQQRVHPWLMECFGPAISADKQERNHRFLEEALETVQAGGCTASEAHQLVDYVFGRPVGELGQEVGGAMTTLAALCLAHGIDMHAEAEKELARVWTMVEKIRAKQAAKPKHSPLPAAPAAPAVDAELLELAQAIVKFNREHGSVLAVHVDNLAELVDERATKAAP